MRDEYITLVAVLAFAAFFFGGIGWLIYEDTKQQERLYNACIESGKQYIKGICVN